MHTEQFVTCKRHILLDLIVETVAAKLSIMHVWVLAL